MGANDDVRVIRADCTCPECISMPLSSSPNCISDNGEVLLTKPDNLVVKSLLGFAVELPKFLARGLNTLATLMDVSHVFQFVFAGFGRPASARIVAQPVGISGKNQMGCENYSTWRIFRISAKEQAGRKGAPRWRVFHDQPLIQNLFSQLAPSRKTRRSRSIRTSTPPTQESASAPDSTHSTHHPAPARSWESERHTSSLT